MFIIGKSIIWVILGLESILIVAMLITGLRYRFASGDWIRRVNGIRPDVIISELDALSRLEDRNLLLTNLKFFVERIRDNWKQTKSPASKITYYILQHGDRSDEGWHRYTEEHLLAVERGAVRIASVIARTAPLIGLAGTMLGVRESLGALGTQGFSPEAVMQGFALAIDSTLIGVLVSFMAVMVAKVLWVPKLRSIRSGMFMFGDEVMERVTTIRNHLKNSKNRQNRQALHIALEGATTS